MLKLLFRFLTMFPNQKGRAELNLLALNYQSAELLQQGEIELAFPLAKKALELAQSIYSHHHKTLFYCSVNISPTIAKKSLR